MNIAPQIRRNLARGIPPKKAAKAPAFANVLATAYSNAAAHVEAIDALRPNAAYGLHPTPAALGTKLTAGQAAVCQKITIEAGTTVVGIYASPNDDANGVVLTSLKFGSTEVCKNGPIPLSMISDRILRSDRLIPLIGHRLPQPLDVTATVFLQNAADQFFRGIGILVIDGTCRPVTTNAAPAPGFAGFGRIVPYVRKALTQFGPRVIR